MTLDREPDPQFNMQSKSFCARDILQFGNFSKIQQAWSI